jgi:hypothetical protein
MSTASLFQTLIAQQVRQQKTIWGHHIVYDYSNILNCTVSYELVKYIAIWRFNPKHISGIMFHYETLYWGGYQEVSTENLWQIC